jgi:hypothetical protein
MGNPSPVAGTGVVADMLDQPMSSDPLILKR